MKALFVGESWVIHSIHIKGFDQFHESRYDEGGKWLIEALQKGGFEVDYMPCHVAAKEFPNSLQELQKYDVIILSDIGSNTLLMPQEVFYQGQRRVNRLQLICEYVKQGGGFAMMGGYMSFSGIEGKAHYGRTALAEILPVKLVDGDDRVETPEGVTPVMTQRDHPILQGIQEDWPHFLGYNLLLAKEGAQIIAKAKDDIFMAAMDVGKGRSFAFASDISPHWGSPEFLKWESYDTLFSNIALWLCRKI